MQKIKQYREALLSAKDESTYEQIANLFSDGLLEYSDFPNEYLDFLIEILSDVQHYTTQGSYYLLAIIGVDTYIMTPSQLAAISEAITNNFINYDDEMLCLTACDFIARYYPASDAEKNLLELKRLEQGKVEKGFADDGLRTLRNGLSRLEYAGFKNKS